MTAAYQSTAASPLGNFTQVGDPFKCPPFSIALPHGRHTSLRSPLCSLFDPMCSSCPRDLSRFPFIATHLALTPLCSHPSPHTSLALLSLLPDGALLRAPRQRPAPVLPQLVRYVRLRPRRYHHHRWCQQQQWRGHGLPRASRFFPTPAAPPPPAITPPPSWLPAAPRPPPAPASSTRLRCPQPHTSPFHNPRCMSSLILPVSPSNPPFSLLCSAHTPYLSPLSLSPPTCTTARTATCRR